MSTTLRVLLVEDSADDAELVVRRLRHEGYSVDFQRVQEAAEMKEALAARDWQLVISDFTMPTFDALQALSVLQGSGHDIPFIIVSGTVGETTAVEAMRAGASDYLLKGNLNRLGAAVARELEGAGQRSERRQTQAALRLSEDYNRALLRAIPDLILRVRRDGRYLDVIVGEGATPFLGTDGLVGRSVAEGLPPEVARSYLQCVEQVLDEGGTRSLEYGFETLAGHRVFESRITPCGQSEILDIARDVTRQRSMEERLRAGQRMEALGRLAGGIAHDFNNLTMIIGASCEFLRDSLPDDPQAQQDIEAIRVASERASSLTRQLLAFSRKQLRQLQIIDINAMVPALEKILRHAIRENVILVVQLASEPCVVHADPSQIEQIFLNLALNARDAMPEGGSLAIAVFLEAVGVGRVSEGGVEVPPGDYVVIEVSDSGFGMDEETKGQIFEPFYTTKEESKGTGLGLATVFGIVRQSDGFIEVESIPGEGAAFKVYLPRVDACPLEKRPTIQPVAPDGTEVILLVEDEPMVRRVTGRLLRSAGYCVLEAGNGGEALKVSQAYASRIHLLLTDVVMPGSNGRRTAQELVSGRPDLKVVFMSGYAGNEMGEAGVLPVGEHFLEKPFDRQALLEKVRTALAGD
jgi:hypothetical protein